MRENPDTPKTFFNPHPGFLGAAIPIPLKVRRVAEELDKKRMPLSEAVARIKAVTEGDWIVATHDGWISLLIHNQTSGARHLFNVIRFR